MLILGDRVKETTSTTGTTDWSLAGAVSGFVAFSGLLSDTDTTYYSASDGASAWEVGLGTYQSSGNVLKRTQVLASSNSNNAVNFATAPTVWMDFPAASVMQAIMSAAIALTGAGMCGAI